MVAAINQMFAEFELVYHNQYHKAFPTAEKLAWAKRLWYSNLAHFTPEAIVDAAHKAVRQSQFLPTVASIVRYCESGLAELGLPAPRDAYVEACRAGRPRDRWPWSHPAVYLAGRDSDWFFLESTPEERAWPVFAEHYRRYCHRVAAGETLGVEPVGRLDHKAPHPLERAEQRRRLARLRDETGI